MLEVSLRGVEVSASRSLLRRRKQVETKTHVEQHWFTTGTGTGTGLGTGTGTGRGTGTGTGITGCWKKEDNKFVWFCIVAIAKKKAALML